MAFNPKDYPVVVLEKYREIKAFCDYLASDNADSLIVREGDNLYLRIEDKNDARFYYEITTFGIPGVPPHNVTAHVNYFPQTSALYKVYKSVFNTDRIKESVLIWWRTVRSYDQFAKPEDQFYKQYADEFYSEWKIPGEDADFLPFTVKQQVF